MFLGKRVALPLFFERAVIEISPRRAFLWEGGRTDRAAAGLRARRGRAVKPSPELLAGLGERFEHAVIVFVDGEGYPLSVATDFRADPERGIVALRRRCRRRGAAAARRAGQRRLQPHPAAAGHRLRRAQVRLAVGEARARRRRRRARADARPRPRLGRGGGAVLRVLRAQRAPGAALLRAGLRRDGPRRAAEALVRLAVPARDATPVPVRDVRADPARDRRRRVRQRLQLVARAAHAGRRRCDPPRGQRLQRRLRHAERRGRGERQPDAVQRRLARDPVRAREHAADGVARVRVLRRRDRHRRAARRAARLGSGVARRRRRADRVLLHRAAASTRAPRARRGRGCGRVRADHGARRLLRAGARVRARAGAGVDPGRDPDRARSST